MEISIESGDSVRNYNNFHIANMGRRYYLGREGPTPDDYVLVSLKKDFRHYSGVLDEDLDTSHNLGSYTMFYRSEKYEEVKKRYNKIIEAIESGKTLIHLEDIL